MEEKSGGGHFPLSSGGSSGVRADFYVARKDGIQRRQSRKFAGVADCLFYW